MEFKNILKEIYLIIFILVVKHEPVKNKKSSVVRTNAVSWLEELSDCPCFFWIHLNKESTTSCHSCFDKVAVMWRMFWQSPFNNVKHRIILQSSQRNKHLWCTVPEPCSFLNIDTCHEPGKWGYNINGVW